ncbi:MAG: hypothetical protein HKN42_18430 [Granulosicoccus sp.]|nr:hypothetical protein [Granulosicoccus sp.]
MIWATVSWMLTACEPGSPQLGGASPLSGKPASGRVAPLSDAAFEGLPLDDQYRVINKLMATLFTGLPVAEFYALDATEPLSRRRQDALRLSDIRTQLQLDLQAESRQQYDREIAGGTSTTMDDDGQALEVEPMFHFDGNRPKQMPLARMFHYPLSRDSFSQWMAWHLANTILFSPAEEIDSADITDVQNIFRRLDLGIMSGQSIRAMVATHQNSVQNWRRFRSPEDNTREMMEIYLGLFDRDADVPLASQACQDLYLTDESDGYKLAYTDYPNTEAVLVLDRYVVNCRDFYDVVAGHPLLIPRVASVLVDYFFAGHSVEDRLAITRSISDSQPVTFEDIFLAILFSETYLLDTERARSFEEGFLPMAKRLQWDAHPDLFRGMISGNGGLSRTHMTEMGWPSMSFKLGRVASIPLDSLSFGNYHKALRESLMLDSRRWRTALGVQQPAQPSPTPVEPLKADATAREIASHQSELAAYHQAVSELSDEERALHQRELAAYEIEAELYRHIDDLTIPQLVDYLFLTAVQRRASVEERRELINLFYAHGHLDAEYANAFARAGRQDDIALITLDYLSRLPELYYLPRLR